MSSYDFSRHLNATPFIDGKYEEEKALSNSKRKLNIQDPSLWLQLGTLPERALPFLPNFASQFVVKGSRGFIFGATRQLQFIRVQVADGRWKLDDGEGEALTESQTLRQLGQCSMDFS